MMLLLFFIYTTDVSANRYYDFNAYQVSSLKLKNGKIKMILDKKDVVSKKRTTGDSLKGKFKDKHVSSITFFNPKKNIGILMEDKHILWKQERLSYKKIKKIISDQRKAYKVFLNKNDLKPSKEANDKYTDFLEEKCIKTYHIEIATSDSGKLIHCNIYGIRYGENKGRTKAAS